MRRTPIVSRLLLAATLATTVGAASGADQAILGTRLVLRIAKGQQKLTFLSNDPTVRIPSIGSAGDPAQGPGGLGVELWTVQGGGLGVQLQAPAGIGWTTRPVPTVTYTYKGGATASIRRAVLQDRRQARVNAAWTAPTLPGPLGGVAVVLLFNSGVRRCVFFGPETILQDVPGRFVAKNAAPTLTDCSQGLPTTTTIATTTTSSSTATTPPTTSTTLLGVCGDGVVNQPSERCDGSDLSLYCAESGGCTAAADVDACRCCTIADRGCGGGGSIVAPRCCDGLTCKQVSSYGTAYTHVCTDLTCGAGDGCDTGGSCVNGGCCNAEGAGCGQYLSTNLWTTSPLPCCPGTTCAFSGEVVNGYAQLTCQVITGKPCTTWADCSPHSCVNGFCD